MRPAKGAPSSTQLLWLTVKVFTESPIPNCRHYHLQQLVNVIGQEHTALPQSPILQMWHSTRFGLTGGTPTNRYRQRERIELRDLGFLCFSPPLQCQLDVVFSAWRRLISRNEKILRQSWTLLLIPNVFPARFRSRRGLK